MDHPFKPHPTDPARCGVQLPSCAPWPAPPTQTCWGLASQHPAAQVVHLVADSADFTALCGQEIDGHNHTGHLSLTDMFGDENCAQCVRLRGPHGTPEATS